MEHITKRIAAVLCAAAMLGTIVSCGPDTGAQEGGNIQPQTSLAPLGPAAVTAGRGSVMR